MVLHSVLMEQGWFEPSVCSCRFQTSTGVFGADKEVPLGDTGKVRQITATKYVCGIPESSL